MAETQLYDQNHVPVYPVSIDSYIRSTAVSGTVDVNGALSYLNNKVNQLTGDAPAVTSIKVEVMYAKTYISNKSSIEVATAADGVNWNPDFIKPDAADPYTWKRTIFSVGDDKYKFYEIVATTMSEKTLTIYYATNSNLYEVTLPEVGDKGEIESLEPWSESPQAISASKPDLYMAIRYMTNGEWGDFTEPVQCGKWAYDSLMVLRYRVTSITNTDVPYVDKTADVPKDWELSSPKDFKGKLWIITATTVNGTPVAYADNNKWSEPNLISIIQ